MIPPANFASQTLGLGLAHAPTRLNLNLAPVDLDGQRGERPGRHRKGPQRLGDLLCRTIRASCGHEPRISPCGAPSDQLECFEGWVSASDN